MAIAALYKLQQLLENEDAAEEEGSPHHSNEIESVFETAVHTNTQLSTTKDTQI